MAGTPMSAAIWDEASGPPFQSPPVALPGRTRRVPLERPARPCARHAPVGLAPGQGTAGFVSLTSRESPSPAARSRTPSVTPAPPAFPAATILDPPPCASTRRPRPASRPSITAPLTRAALRLRTPGTLQPYCHLVPLSIGRQQEGPATRNHVGPGQTDAARNAKRAPGHSPRGPLTCRQLYRGV